MKISNKDIDELVTSFVGEDVTPLIMILKNKSNVSEFKLADELNITVNQVRNMLYRLYKYNLVSFVRKKDKKKGWYIYYWTLSMKYVKEELIKLKKSRLEEFRAKLKTEEGGSFFMCPNKCMRVKLENAMDYGFRCQECGSLLVEQSNKRTIENLKNRIRELEEEVKAEEEELRLKMKKYRRREAKKEARKEAKKLKEKKPIKKKVVKKKLKKKVVKKKVKKPIKKKFAKKKVKKRFKPASKKKPVKKKFVPKKNLQKKKFSLKRLGKKFLKKVRKR